MWLSWCPSPPVLCSVHIPSLALTQCLNRLSSWVEQSSLLGGASDGHCSLHAHKHLPYWEASVCVSVGLDFSEAPALYWPHGQMLHLRSIAYDALASLIQQLLCLCQ